MNERNNNMEENNIIIYNTDDGKAKVVLYAKDGNIWMNQKQLAELFDTSVPNVNMHIANILKDGELDENSVIKDYLITVADGKDYKMRKLILMTIFVTSRKWLQ